VAAALLVIGGLVPFVFGGTSSRIDGVIFPFWVGALVFAACAFLPNQSRGVTGLLYFVGGLAVVYGLLSIFSLPVRLAVLGTCPALPAPCTTGLPRPLSDGENNGLGAAATLGILAIFLGFYGLVTVYRRSAPAPNSPPVRTIPPVAPPHETVAATATPAPEKPDPEPEEVPELEAPEELPELPPHESTPSTI
jgi:hypothetical protein